MPHCWNSYVAAQLITSSEILVVMTYVLNLPHADTQLHHVEFALEITKFVTPHLHLHVSKIPNEDCHVSWIIDEISNCEYLQKVHTLVININIVKSK